MQPFNPRYLFLIGLLVCALAIFPSQAFAEDDVEQLKKEVQTLKEKIEELEKDSSWNTDDIDYLSDRMDEAEMHTATDKVSFGFYLRTRAESIHYNDIRMAPSPVINSFFASPPNGFNGATKAQIQQGMANMAAAGMVPPPDEYDVDNDIIYTNKLRMDMKAQVNRKLSFRGRLAAYKVFGDSTGVKFNQGSLGDVTLDGNTSSLPHGDTIHMERAYFVYNNDLQNVPISLSVGRRPSTQGPPMEYRNYALVGGSPLSTIINWQFDGASLTFGMEDVTGIPGASFKICYGVGFEDDWGNASSLNYSKADLEDVHMLGFIVDLFDNGNTSAMFNYAHAWDVTDGFTGLSVMPFTIAPEDRNGDGTAEYYFEANNGGFISRLEPSTNIGDWDAASLLLRSKIPTPNDQIDWFLAGSYSHTDPSKVSENPFFNLMGMGLLSSNGDLESRDGYSIYGGVICPMPLNARLGLEYNWGSKYWFNFTGAEDSLIGSKLATRGEVYEAYYIQPVMARNFFLKLGGQFYDYEYTGSGNPIGKPVEIDDTTAFDTINPVIDKVWNAYLSATVQF
ncbi:MAG TPA: DUF3373 family protein [Desulfosalsimonadaceae bacterium]|nr:DUF3373 family protein [Desulfosalsimonadaceae bacterium]